MNNWLNPVAGVNPFGMEEEQLPHSPMYSPFGQQPPQAFTQQPTGTDWGSMSTWLGGTNAQGQMGLGILPKAIGLGSSVYNVLMGSKMLQQQKAQFEFNKQTVQNQNRLNVQEINRSMRDKAKARELINKDKYGTAEDYMKKNKLKV